MQLSRSLGNSAHKNLSFRMNFSWIFLGKTFYLLCQFAVLVVFTKIGTPIMVGMYGLANAINAPVFLFFDLGLRSVLSTDVKDEYSINNYISVRFFTSLIAILLVLLVVMLTDYSLWGIIVICLISFSKAVESISDVLYGIMQKNEKLHFQAKSMIFKGALTFLGVGLSMYLTHSLIISLIVMILMWTMILVVWDIQKTVLLLPSYRALIPKLDILNIYNLFSKTWPLAFEGVINSLRINIPRYLVGGMCGTTELGYFTALSYIPVAGDAIIMSLQYAALPRLAKIRLQDDKKFITLLIKVIMIGAGLGVIGILFAQFCGTYFLRLIYNDQYAYYNNVFVWLMIGAMGSYINAFITSSLIVLRCFNLRAIVSAISTSSCLIVAFLTIKHCGMSGAAYAIVVSSWLNVVLGGLAVLISMRHSMAVRI